MYFADNILGTRRYFAGDQFTAADIMMHFPLKIGVAVAAKIPFVIGDLYEMDLPHADRFPNVKRWLQDVMGRSTWRRTVGVTLPAGPPPF